MHKFLAISRWSGYEYYEFDKGYVSGVIDAEASFSVSVKVQRDLLCKVRVDPVFSMTERKREVLEIVQRVLRCGRIIQKPGQRHLWMLVVDDLDELSRKLIPALDELKLVAKKSSYDYFREIVLKLAEKKYSLTCDEIRELVIMAYKLSDLNLKSSRKRSIIEVLSLIPVSDDYKVG